jgi:lipid II isoglutaminyl synthase (glutamine-hydrolysing)
MFAVGVISMKRLKKITLRFLVALYIGKIIQFIIRGIYRDKGTNLPGRVAIKVCPDFLSRIGRPKTVIAVTGTNGKTSVSNFINSILNNNNISTINNSKGSNMPSGIASALIEKASILGTVKAEVAILEVDERASGFVYDHIPPTYLLCTNLFRDSIKRNGHSEFILTKIKSSVPKSTILILNGDDLISSQIGNDDNSKIFFGVEKTDNDKSFENIVSDIVVCPVCKYKLQYRYRHYHHIGKAYCEKCSFESPELNYKVIKVDYKKKMFTLTEEKKKYTYKLISDSIFNVYNMVSVIALARTYGLSHEQIKGAFNQLILKKDRFDSDVVNNIEIITMLSKNQNPISCSRVFEYVANQPGNKAIVLYITDSLDHAHGSEDISWLYDVDFEYLNNSEIKQIIVGGTRYYDVLLRLKLAGIKEDIINGQNNYDSIDELLNINGIDKIYILYELYAYPLASKLKQRVIKKLGEYNG